MRVNLEKLKKRDDGAATQRHRPRSLRGILLASSDAHPVLEIRDIFRRASLVSVSVSQDTRVSCILFHGTSAWRLKQRALLKCCISSQKAWWASGIPLLGVSVDGSESQWREPPPRSIWLVAQFSMPDIAIPDLDWSALIPRGRSCSALSRLY